MTATMLRSRRLTSFSRSCIFLAQFQLILVLLISSFAVQLLAQGCSDPAASIIKIMDCIEQSNATCATSGYDSDKFVKLHNGVDTNTTIDSGSDYWTRAFALLSIALDYDHVLNIGPNKASLRYIEKVVMTNGTSVGLPAPSTEYPFGATFYQYEHALVSVNNDCKMVKWDQYGDNEEQAAVDNAANAVLCKIGALPAAICNATNPH